MQFRAALINDTTDGCATIDDDNDEHERNCCAKTPVQLAPNFVSRRPTLPFRRRSDDRAETLITMTMI